MGRRAKTKQPPPEPLPDATNIPDRRPSKRKAEEELERLHKKPKQEKNVQAKPVKRVKMPAKKQKEPSHKGNAKGPTPEESDDDGLEGVADVPDLATSKKYSHTVFLYCIIGVDPSIVGPCLPKATKARVRRVWKSWMRTMNLTKKMKCAHSFSWFHFIFCCAEKRYFIRADDLLQASRIEQSLCRERS